MRGVAHRKAPVEGRRSRIATVGRACPDTWARLERCGLITAGLLWLGSGGAGAAPVQLGEDELRAAVVGKTVRIDTPLGMPITVSYSANGLMSGTANAALAVYLGAPKDRGRWQVRDGKLCQKWFKWLDADTTCLTIRLDGNRIMWRSDEGKTGTAMIEPGPPVLAGVNPSGLGLTQEPALPAARAAAGTEPPEAHEREETDKERGPDALAQKLAALTPTLVQGPREAPRPARFVGSMEMLPARVSMASLNLAPGPVRSPQPEPPLVTAMPVAAFVIDPFAAEAQPMRAAADLTAIGALEHRWCHANAFAKGPMPPAGLEISAEAAPEAVAAPSLFSVAQEQAYEGELPLHQASCLTAEPAIHSVAKLALSVR